MKSFESEIVDDGVILRLSTRKKSLLSSQYKRYTINDWTSSGDPDLLRGLASIHEEISQCDPDSDFIKLSHKRASSLEEVEAKALGLPISVPYQLRVWSSGNWNDNTYDLNSEFLDDGRQIYVDERTGAFLFIGKYKYRIPEPLYSIIEEVNKFPTHRDQKIESQARIRDLLGDEKNNTQHINAEENIINLKIRHVSGFSSAVTGSLDDPELTPVLFSKKTIEKDKDGSDQIDETQQILDENQNISFLREFFASDSSKATYVLGTGEYIYIDPSMRPVFDAYRKITTSDQKTRTAFLKSPNSMLASFMTYELEEPEQSIHNVFVETSQFSERVIGINKWTAPELPWLKQEANNWGTDVVIFEQIGNGTPVVLPKDHLEEAVSVLQSALSEDKSTVNVKGIEIPVSNDLIHAIQDLIHIKPDPEIKPNPDPEPEPLSKGPFVVQTIDGFEVINYVKAITPPKNKILFDTPRALVPSTIPMQHQNEGVNWLIDAYNIGVPGVLNADDMGLGKTLQTLIFLSLYQEQTNHKNQNPCLIVAPTGLLKNWLEEIEIHLGKNGLGEITLAYGRGLKDLKTGGGRDVETGIPILDIKKLSQSNIVLTTYESLRDYQISFAKIEFGIAVFDEIQKTKNPKSLISRSAAAVNANFKIGLSGTPVENSLADLWTVLDLIAPGLIKLSLKDFMQLYSNPECEEYIDNLRKLHKELLEPSKNNINPMLRRLKSEIFGDDMPKKITHPASSTCVTMPNEQAQIYKEYLDKAISGQVKMIQALQFFKRISLAPKPYEKWMDNIEDFIDSSGKLTEFFRLLDQIRQRNEKVLIFVESRELQKILAQVLKERFNLDKLPLIINGAISGESRQNYVNQFQSEKDGFGTILISPKAGGIGLTLTAANNVIHLERWWNPAVEDQCNDRAYRIGQTKDVNIYTPITKHPIAEIPSFDVVLDDILNKKRKLAHSLLIPSEIQTKDFQNMLGMRLNKDNKQINSRITVSESYEIESGEDFENYVADLIHQSGFTVHKTQRSWDAGCDLIVKDEKITILCQIKQVRSDKSLQDGVDEVLYAKNRYSSHNPSHLCLITNALNLSRSQMKLANDNNVIVLAGDKIDKYGEMLRQHASLR